MQTRSRSGALLTELIVVVLVFTLCASVLVQLFSVSVGLGRKAGASNEALNAAENAAELLSESDSPEQALLSLGFTARDGAYLLETDAYSLEAEYHEEPREAGTMLVWSIKATRGADVLFTLPGKSYRGAEDA